MFFYFLWLSCYRALEEFHQLYQRSSSVHNPQHELEEIYVMGYRIVSFLTECLPNHPRLKHSPFVLEQSEIELQHLRKCLEDVALRIDTIVCNETVDEGDNYLDMIIAEQMEQVDDDDDDDEWEPSNSDNSKSSSSSSDFDIMPFQLESWVNFDDFKKFEDTNSANLKKERRLSESSTSDTVGTSGTESGDDVSNSSSKSKSPDRRRSKSKKQGSSFDDFDSIIREDDDIKNRYPPHWDDESLKSYSSQPLTLLRKSANLDFLKKVACEPVLFESDSDADDSWANGEDKTVDSKSRRSHSSSSGAAPTSDPARLAFRNIMDKFPLQCQSPSQPATHCEPSIKSPINSPKRLSNIKLPLKPIFKGNRQMPSEPSLHNEPLPEATEAPTESSARFAFPDIMEQLPHESLLHWNCKSRCESPTFSDVDDDILDQVVEDEIQAYLQETQNPNPRKEVQPGDQTDRRISEQEQQRRESPPRKTEKEELGTQEFRRRKLDQKLDEQQQKIEQQHRSSVDRTVRSAVPTFKSSDSVRSNSKKKRSVSFDEKSISTSSTTSFSMANSTATPSSHSSLGPLRGANSIGSQTSAFSVYSRRKAKQQYQYKTGSEDQPFDEVQEDWINFRNGSGFFSQ